LNLKKKRKGAVKLQLNGQGLIVIPSIVKGRSTKSNVTLHLKGASEPTASKKRPHLKKGKTTKTG